ncbi:molybdenum cofactor guanylyltransferase [Schlesneria sp. DSM 10557]|uniref:molybdenum cofactor guanylyltransferase n=1 Tax=Schlesneria sp. DSM 10557 TaxID=3044399 RepID=UPI0035C81D1E
MSPDPGRAATQQTTPVDKKGRSVNKGAIILCGGESTRMGHDKASLPFGPETMLQRVVRLLSSVIDSSRIVVVAAAGQHLPNLPPEVRLARDQHSRRGPLEGFAAGLRLLQSQVDAVFLSSCDSPRLVPDVVELLFHRLGEVDIAVPFDGTYEHPLTAVYRATVLKRVETQLAGNRFSLRSLFDQVSTVRVPTEELRTVDSHLTTLANLNSPEEYRKALLEMGFESDHPSFLE